MKGFLKYIALFFLPIVLLLTLMEMMLRTIPNNYKVKSNYIENHSEDIETLILGNSHTYYGLNPEWMDGETFNMSHVSQSLDIDLAILRHYLPNMSQLKTVVMRLSYDSMFEILSETDEHWRYKDYALYTKIPLNYKTKHHFELLSISFKENLKRLLNFYIKNQPSVTCNNLGWGMDANFQNSMDLDKTGLLIAKKHTASSNTLFDPNIKTLHEIARLMALNKVKLIVVTTPAFESYSSNLNELQLNETLNVGMQLEENFENVNYYNFLDDRRFDKIHFFDANHLNNLGAELFSTLVNDILHN